MPAGAAAGGVTCGIDTIEAHGQCVPNLHCGSGTVENAGACVATVTCGDGTTAADGKCEPDVTCGKDTVEMAGTCVPTLTCGDGTITVDGACAPVVTCGPDTTVKDGKCVPDLQCGDGTTAVGGVCVPVVPSFLVRAAVTRVAADGKTTIPVFAIGSTADGAPALDPLVFTVEPATAGTFPDADATLTALGFTTTFTPCDSAVPTCTGTFTIRIATKADPTAILATTGAIELVAPPPTTPTDSRREVRR
ncbi:MAG TPA: hypothetical protein VFP84_07560 [Kofleriaceae bacterium]|nr:hypothetical protein [Kofleriaceae bacterium]